jgi:hypothetical protein
MSKEMESKTELEGLEMVRKMEMARVTVIEIET